jgi:hypothetical protein
MGRSRERAAAAALALSLALPALAAHRSSSMRAAFKRANPCPATGKITGACPGFVIDHIEPLCAGGEDHPRNLQWQSTEAAAVKDRFEWERCRQLRRSAR